MKRVIYLSVAAVLFSLAPHVLNAQTYLPINTESASARAHFTQGIKAFDAARGDDARMHFDMAIKADGKLAAAHLFRSYTATSGADYMAHFNHATALHQSATNFVKLLIDRDAAGIENDSEKQLEAMKNLVAMYPNNPRAHIELGNEYQYNKEIAEARMEYHAAVELAPGFPQARKVLSGTYLFDEPTSNTAARWNAQRYLNRASDEADPYIVLGDVFRDNSDFEQARDTYAQASEVDPKNMIAHSKRGHANTFLKNYSAAEADFKQAAGLAKTLGARANMEAFGSYSPLYKGDVDAGLKANSAILEMLMASDAVESEKTFPIMNAYWQRGQIALRYGMYGEAQKAFDARSKWVDKAVTQMGSEFENGLRAGVAVWNGFVAARTGDLKTARKFAEQNKALLADESNPRRYEIYHHLMGVIEYEAGNYESAVEHLSHADVDWILTKYNTAMAYEKAGNSESAMELYKEVSEWNFNGVFTALYRSAAAEKVALTSAANM